MQYSMSSYILAVAFGVTALTLTTTGWCDAARVTALEAMLLGTSPTTSQADVMSKLYDALGEVIQLEVDGVRYPPRAIEACTTDTHDFCYQPCGFRHERAADRPVKVSADFDRKAGVSISQPLTAEGQHERLVRDAAQRRSSRGLACGGRGSVVERRWPSRDEAPRPGAPVPAGADHPARTTLGGKNHLGSRSRPS